MTDSVLPDVSTPFGERVARRLDSEMVIWLTTVGADGTPQPNPVWFITNGTEILIYNRPDAMRLAHIRSRPRVSLNFDGNSDGGDIIVLTGSATILTDQPLPHEVPAYAAKYGAAAAAISGDVEAFSAEYSVAVRVDVTRVRGF